MDDSICKPHHYRRILNTVYVELIIVSKTSKESSRFVLSGVLEFMLFRDRTVIMALLVRSKRFIFL
jgi:hypothetical protein